MIRGAQGGNALARTVGNFVWRRERFRFHRETWAKGFGGGRSALTPPIEARILGLGAGLALAAFHLFATQKRGRVGANEFSLREWIRRAAKFGRDHVAADRCRPLGASATCYLDVLLQRERSLGGERP